MGHSAGGTIAQQLASKYRDAITVSFNPGEGLGAQNHDYVNNPRLRSYQVDNDLVCHFTNPRQKNVILLK